MKSFKFKKIKSERPRKTFFASKGKSRDALKIPRFIFWKVHEAKSIEFFHKKEEEEKIPDDFTKQVFNQEPWPEAEWD